MVKAIPMEDWLRGCIYHDGRHGYVTLPIDKVRQIANYIQRTRRSGMDGLIDLEVVEADRKTEPSETHEIRTDTHECVKDTHDKTEPQTCANGCKWLDQDGCTEPSGECHIEYRTERSE